MNFIITLILIFNILKYKISLHFFPHSTPKYKVVFKADDLNGINKNVIRLDKIIEKEKICVSWGIIGNSLENADKQYLSFLNNKKNNANYHFFNHGYTHSFPPESYEFYEQSSESQYNSMIKTQKIVKDKIGIDLDTFGAPCNHIDNNTTTAIEQISEIKYWYYGNDCSKIKLRPTIGLEKGIGNPDFFYFRKNWNNFKDKNGLLSLQMHPNLWNKHQFLHFKACILFLKFQGTVFITPPKGNIK